MPSTRRVAVALCYLMLLLTLVLTYGGENLVLFPRGVPVVWVVATVLCLIVGWRGMRLMATHRRGLFLLLSAVVLGGLVRLAVDVKTEGILALRDSIFFLSGLVLPVGLFMGYSLDLPRVRRIVVVPVVMTVLYGWTFPWWESLESLFVVSGPFRDVPLLGQYSTSYIALAAAWGGILSGFARGLAGLLLIVAVLGTTALTQTRLGYMALPVSTLITAWVFIKARRPGRILVHSAVVGVAVLAFLTISSIAPIPGKHGAFSGGFFWEHLWTITGAEGPASGSVAHRYSDYPVAVQALLNQPLVSLVFGSGLGGEMDTGATGVLARRLHLDAVEVTYRAGIVGLLWVLLVFSVWAGVMRESVRWIARGVLPSSDMAAVTMVCTLLTFTVVTSLFQPVFFWAYGSLPYFFYAGLALGMFHGLETGTPRRWYATSPNP